MANVNRVILIGRLIKDPELKYTAQEKPVLSATLVTNKVWMKDGEKQEKSEFHNLVIWGKQAETFNKYTSKGSEVYLEGELQTDSWDGDDGKKRYRTLVNVVYFQFIGGNKDRNDALKKANNKQQDYKISTDTSFANDDIPF